MEEASVNTKESEKDGTKQSKEEEQVTGRKRRRERRLKTQPKNVTGSGAPDTTGPRGICVSDFIQARAMEVYNMTAAIAQHGSARRTFQTLPRHMRRRSMSHNIKRLPHRLREQAKNEVVECTAKKKLSRKTRRRSNKLLEGYGSRSEKCRWLQTHIWHAKRFKMMEYHGYKIAEQCCDKGARATYRYLHTGCLLYDSSYHGCVELLGSQDDIVTVLQPLMSKQVGITIEAKDCLDGCRSGDTILYQSYSYPTNAIGPAQFIWRPDQSTAQRQLWLLVHPAITDVLMKEISNNIKTLLGAGINDIVVNNLQDKMVRYKLIGARCNCVIVQTIDPVWEPLDDKGVTGKWSVTEQPTDNDGLADKKKFFEHLSQIESPAEFPNRMIVGLTVKDFRLSMPDTKVNITQPAVTSVSSTPEIVTPQLSQCFNWDKGVRDSEQGIVPEYLINKIRSEKFRDFSEQLKEVEEYLPLLLLHQTVDGVGVGWDILAPVKWGKPLWLSLVYHGARVIGYEEMKYYHLEQSILHYPTDYPDTVAGQQLELNNLKVLQLKYCKYPPDKRPNFGKLNSLSPFQPLWSSLISCDTERGDKEQDNGPVCKKPRLSTDSGLVEDGGISYYVLRSVKPLVALAKLLDNLKVVVKPACEEKWLSLLNDMQLSTLLSDYPKSLVPVSFVMCRRGNPTARSMICIPSTEDLLKLSNDESYYGPVEELNKKGICILHDDKLLIGTTLLSNKKFKMAKKELKIGKISKKSQVTKDVSHHDDQSNEEITATLQLQSLQSSRPIIGYVTNAGYVFSQGVGSGVGLCSLTGLLEFMKSCYLLDHPATVLVREHNSLQYRFAFVNILQMYNCI